MGVNQPELIIGGGTFLLDYFGLFSGMIPNPIIHSFLASVVSFAAELMYEQGMDIQMLFQSGNLWDMFWIGLGSAVGLLLGNAFSGGAIAVLIASLGAILAYRWKATNKMQ